MAEETHRTFSHFSMLRFGDRYWGQDPKSRRQPVCAALEALRGGVDALHLYQTFGIEAGPDLLVWSAVDGGDPAIPARFFTHLARALSPIRDLVTLSTALWGFTQPSQYTKTRSRQEIDPFTGERSPYLRDVPLHENPLMWYQKTREERREMMLRAHPSSASSTRTSPNSSFTPPVCRIRRFVVVYETVDLTRFRTSSPSFAARREDRSRSGTRRCTPRCIEGEDWGTVSQWL